MTTAYVDHLAMRTVARLRAQAVELRTMADQLLAEARSLERAACSLPPIPGPECVRRLTDDLAGAEATFSVDDLLDWLAKHHGVQPRGLDPKATLITSLHRHDRWQTIGCRSGLWYCP